MRRDSSFLYKARYERRALPHFADHEPETVLCLCLLARVPRKADAPSPSLMQSCHVRTPN